jgi:hypothetical protein
LSYCTVSPYLEQMQFDLYFFYLVLFQVQKRREEPYVMVDL